MIGTGKQIAGLVKAGKRIGGSARLGKQRKGIPFFAFKQLVLQKMRDPCRNFYRIVFLLRFKAGVD